VRVSVNATTLTFRALQASHARGGITGECGGSFDHCCPAEIGGYRVRCRLVGIDDGWGEDFPWHFSIPRKTPLLGYYK
jgi:hypothetical protein